MSLTEGENKEQAETENMGKIVEDAPATDNNDQVETETGESTQQESDKQNETNSPNLEIEQSSENAVATSKDDSSSAGGNEGSKDSDFQPNNSDNDSRSSTSMPPKNTARRGKKRKIAESAPQRETPRRAARRVKKYTEDDAFNDLELEDETVDDPDFQFSDSDDDPDFDPSHKKNAGSPDLDIRPKRGKGSRGRGRGGFTPGRIDLSNSRKGSTDDENSENTSGSPRKRGRPPTYANNSDINTTVIGADDIKSPGKLSSALNYGGTRTRQNQAIRLPEGPNLTDDQLRIIESQFKSGDFVMAKKDTDMMENPPIWRIDGKSLLQKFQAFEKDGKFLYRNISTYSGWTAQAKALYVPVKVKFVFQSRYDTVVELLGFKAEDKEDEQQSQVLDKPVWLPKNKDIEKITDELKEFMPSFEIYLQTLISQALDNNFLQEIYEENDEYFVDKVKTIDDMTQQRMKRILEITKWDEKFQESLDTWPCVNTMVTKNCSKCKACGQKDATMLSQFYGQPYDSMTLRFKDPSDWDLEHKNFETCDSCSTLSQLFNKVTHQKYDYYSQCKSTVTNMRVSQPNKTTTNVLRDLLANDEWINGLFRAMCTTWIKIDNLYEIESKKTSSQEPQKTT